jgi:hypothetical protein
MNRTNTPTVNVLAYGNAGLHELREYLFDDEICYALLRITLGSGKLSKNKYLFIHWVGEKVPVMLRAKALSQGDLAGRIQDFLGGSHLDLQAATIDDLSDHLILNKLKRVIGIEKDVDYSLDSTLFQVRAPQHQHHDYPVQRVMECKDIEQIQTLEQWTIGEQDLSSSDLTVANVIEVSPPKVCMPIYCLFPRQTCAKMIR